MRSHLQLGALLGSGRTADVYALDDPEDGAWVLRRYREGYGDAPAEAAVIEHVRGHGYPVPRVRTADARTDLVMERLSGPTMLEAVAAGELTASAAGTTIAHLLTHLHTISPRLSSNPTARVLHLDLHPENVIVTPSGPMVIDWANTEEGPPGLDWAMSAVILAQVAVADDDPRAPLAHTMLTALLTPCPAPPLLRALPQALQRRATQPTMSSHELELLTEADKLIRTLLS
ncbi:phosphotransferase [Streptomyces sp. NPDC048825]|uniref:phosphotransferase n=1 Tax=Streptomyces sp. NPDC048825 TaxID=3365592 RepID=UPI00371A48F7